MSRHLRSTSFVRAHCDPRRNSTRRAAIITAELLESRRLLSGTSVLTFHNDAASTGANLTESLLNTVNVSVNSFGKSFSTPVDGQIYAQPLYVPGLSVTVNGQTSTHNVVFVATEGDSLYAMDAGNGTVLWQDTFLKQDPALTGTVTVTTVPNSDVGTGDIQPKIGITSTPAIDPVTGYLFLTAKTKQVVSGNATPDYVYTLEKVKISDGTYTSTVIGNTGSSNGSYTYNSGPYVLDPGGQGSGVVNIGGQNRVYFNALRELNRSAVTLYNGNVYMSFASHGDNGPYHGWMLGFKESDLTPTAAFNTDPNGGLSGIWQGGGKIAIDPQGFMYVETGNGTFDTALNAQGFPSTGDYGDSFIKIALDPATTATSQNINGWGLKVVDYFTPMNQDQLSGSDEDLGSGGPIVLPETVGSGAGTITIGNAAHPDLLVGSGKNGVLYLLDRNNMGKYDQTTDHVVQELHGLGGGGSFDTPAFFYDGSKARVYYLAVSSTADSFTISNASLAADTHSGDVYGSRVGSPSVSANGTANGIVWNVDAGSGQLRAYNASNLALELWTSAQNSSRDGLGSGVKFSTPTIADGNVFVGTTSTLVGYDEIAPATTPPAAPDNLAATAASNVAIGLTWRDNATNEAGYFVEQSADAGKTWTQVATVGANSTSYTATGLTPSTPYSFRVRAFNAIGNSAYSNVASATTLSKAAPLSFPVGFANAAGQLTLNGSTTINGTRLELTNGGGQEAGSAFSNSAVSVQGFTTTFRFQLSNANADGFTFTMQNVGPTALGGAGGGLGYANDNGGGGIPNSVCVKFDLYPNTQEGSDSTGVFVNGDSPTYPSGSNPAEASVDMSGSGVDLHSGDTMQVDLSYDGSTLNETVTDTVTNAVFTQSYPINIPAEIGSAFAFVGFTGGTGGATAIQDILNWTYTEVVVKPPAPTNLTVTPASGTELDVAWSEPSGTVTNFNVLRKGPTDSTYIQIAQVPGTTTSYKNTALTSGTTYSYEVVAVSSAGPSLPAGPVSGTTPTAPAAPSNLTVNNVLTTLVTLNWHDNASNATGYVITRQLESDNSQYVTTLPATATSYTDTAVLPGREYAYTVAATNLAGPSDGVNVVVETVPDVPTGLTALPGSDAVVLRWTDSGHAVDRYNIYRSNTAGGEGATPVATNVRATRYVDTGLTAGKTYYYEITAVDGGGTFAGTGSGGNAGAPVLGGGESARSAEASGPAYMPGDTNGDGKVDFKDLVTLAQNYGKPAASALQGDFNGDGLANFADLVILAQNYGKSLTPAATAAAAVFSQTPVTSSNSATELLSVATAGRARHRRA